MPPPSSVEPADTLQEFFFYLGEQGFPCGVGERVRAARVYEAAEQLRGKDRLKTLLCPIFARSVVDQARFYNAFELFWSPRSLVPPPPVQEGERPLTVPQKPAQRRRHWRGERMPRAVALIAAVLTLAGLAYWAGPHLLGLVSRPVRVIDPPPPPTDPAVTWVPVYGLKQVPFERPCGGWECVTAPPRLMTLLVPLMFALAGWGLSGARFWKRLMWRRRERRRAPPFEWPLVTHTPPLAGYQGEFLRAAEALRMRLAGDTDELDVGRTIDATIRAAGFPTMQYRARRKTPEYLFLIERRTPEDHFARWWEDVASALQRLGVTLQVYFYTGDFRRCYQQGSPVGIATSYLLDARESHFVLVVGQGRDLLQGSSSFPSWMEASLVKREHRVLLTPSAAFAWSSAERRVGQHLPVLPARVPNLSAAAGRWDAARWLAADSSELPDIPREYLDTPDGDPGDIPSIAMFLDEDVFQWLCACAVYPKLEWRLTLEMGAKVDPGGAIFSERKLLQLIRLPWFRDGKMPGVWRERLIGQLDPRIAAEVRKLVLEAIAANRAAPGSFARDQQDLQIAAQEYWLAPMDPDRRAALESAIAALPPVDVGEDPLLANLRHRWSQEASFRQPDLYWSRFRFSAWKFAAAGAAAAVALFAFTLRVPVAGTRTQNVITGFQEQRNQPSGEIRIFAGRGADPTMVSKIADLLRPDGGTIASSTGAAPAPPNRLRYYANSDQNYAATIAAKLNQAKYPTTVEYLSPQSPVKGRLELWVAGSLSAPRPPAVTLVSVTWAGTQLSVMTNVDPPPSTAFTVTIDSLPSRTRLLSEGLPVLPKDGLRSLAKGQPAPQDVAFEICLALVRSSTPPGCASGKLPAKPATDSATFARLVAALPPIPFAVDSADIPAKSEIDAIALGMMALLNQHPGGYILVDGFADKNENGGSTLAGQRANNVRTALVNRKVPSSRLRIATHAGNRGVRFSAAAPASAY